jgi:hypothetical protein
MVSELCSEDADSQWQVPARACDVTHSRIPGVNLTPVCEPGKQRSSLVRQQGINADDSCVGQSG